MKYDSKFRTMVSGRLIRDIIQMESVKCDVAYLISTVRPAVRLGGFCFPKKTNQKPTVEGAQHQFGF